MSTVANKYMAKLAILMKGEKPENGRVTVVEGYPTQSNSFDCGIFAICGAEAALAAYPGVDTIENGSCFNGMPTGTKRGEIRRVIQALIAER